MEVSRLGPGDVFGDRSLLYNEARSATVKVTGGNMCCLCLDRTSFTLLLGPFEDILTRHAATYGEYKKRNRSNTGAIEVVDLTIVQIIGIEIYI